MSPFFDLLVVSAFFAFTWNPTTIENRYEGLVEAEVKSEFIASTSSQELIENLSLAFPHLFDKIDRVDIHQADGDPYEQKGIGHVRPTQPQTHQKKSDPIKGCGLEKRRIRLSKVGGILDMAVYR